MISLGSDPEWFLKDSSGKIHSAIGKFGGTKDNPRQLHSPWGRQFSLQEDNVAVEYNTKPALTAGEWVTYHEWVQSVIKAEAADMGLQPAIIASHVFDEDQLKHPKAWIFGCEPDWNAWTRKINPAPKSKEPCLRSAGGHIHFGYTAPNKTISVAMCRLADLLIGLPLMVVDTDERRMELYGKAGAMRFKEYGFEYRTPSNLWTTSKPMLEWVYTQAVNVFVSQKSNLEVPSEVAKVINKRDKEAAKDLMKHYGVKACPL